MNARVGIWVSLLTGFLGANSAMAQVTPMPVPLNEFIWRGNTLTAAKLSGTWGEMGTQAAEFSTDLKGNQSPPRQLNDFLNNHIKQFSNFPPLRWFAELYLKWAVIDPFESRISDEDSDILNASAKAANLKNSMLKRAFVIPDSMNKILGMKTKNSRFAGMIPACSSFAAFGPSTSTGERILARNLDFPMIGSFDVATAVYLMEPVQGYKILTVTMEGVPIPGISGMNEKGLALVLHDAYTTSLKGDGKPIFSVNHEVLSNASNIEEAIAIYKKYTYTSGWIVHITDRNPQDQTPRSALIEVSGNGVTVKWNQNSFTALSNSYQTPEQQKDELVISTGVAVHNRDRLARLNQLIPQMPVDGARAIAILRDSHSPYSDQDVLFTTSGIRAIDQVNSMVFFPDQGKVWVADGADPSSYGSFYEFSFDQMEAGNAPLKVSDSKPVPEALRETIEAYKLNFQEGKIGASYSHLLRAGALAQDCSLELLVGAAALGAGDLKTAQPHLQSAQSCDIYNPHEKSIAKLLAGLIQWYQGDNDSAATSLKDAMATEETLHQGAGIKIDKEFVGVIEKSLQEIDERQTPDLNWIEKLSRIDIKTQDNLFGWN